MSKKISYKRITDFEGNQAVVMVIKVNRRTIHGEVDAFICVDSDDRESLNHFYDLTDAMKAVDLGSYEEFVSRVENLQAYHAILNHQDQAHGPLATIRAIEILNKDTSTLNDVAVLNALIQAETYGEARVEAHKAQIEAIRQAL